MAARACCLSIYTAMSSGIPGGWRTRLPNGCTPARHAAVGASRAWLPPQNKAAGPLLRWPAGTVRARAPGAAREGSPRQPERYDEARALARPDCLSSSASCQHKLTEVTGLRSGARFPAMDPKRRADQDAELDTAIERHAAAVRAAGPDSFRDPEDVPDEHGRLPRDRRYSTHYWYRERRITEVLELWEELPDLERRTQVTADRSERSKLLPGVSVATRSGSDGSGSNRSGSSLAVVRCVVCGGPGGACAGGYCGPVRAGTGRTPGEGRARCRSRSRGRRHGGGRLTSLRRPSGFSATPARQERTCG